MAHGFGREPRPPPKPAGWPQLPGGPAAIHLLGSPGSGGEFVPACADGGDDADDFDRWCAAGTPCAVTDWHVDEPWDAAPARFTVLWAAATEGNIETRFASTAVWDRLDDEDRAVLATAVGTFVPPPWLPQEGAASARHALRRATPAGDAVYVCADSLAAVDGLERRDALALGWRATRLCVERAAAHAWRPKDLLIVDNHQMLHKRVPYDHAAQGRLLYRLRVDAGPGLDC